MPLKKIQFSNFANIVASKIKQGRLAVLAGAGISMVRPTNLPSGDELRNLVIKTITATNELTQYVDLLIKDFNYTNLLPELMFQSLWEHMEHQLGGFFRVLQPANQNEIHRFLMEISNNFFVSIATTNFEHLIEGTDKPHKHILHLHGSLSKTESLVIRLNQIGRTIPLPITKAFLNSVKGKSILILGYSGRDSDVMRLVDSSEAEDVLWLFHNNSDRAAVAAKKSVLRVRYTVGEAPDLVTKLQSDLQISLHYDDQHLRCETDLEEQRKIILSDWQEKLSTEKRYLAISAVLVLAKNFTAADQLLSKGLATFRNSQSWEQYLVGTAAIFRLTANFEQGIDCISEALNNPINLQGSNFTRALNVSGLLLLEKVEPEPSLALERFRKAIDHLKNNGDNPNSLSEMDLQLLARLHNNLGLASEVLGNYTSAVRAYRESIKIKRSIGDIIGIAQSSANLSIACYKSKKYRMSSYWRERALSAAGTYGLDFLKTYILRRIGTASCEQGRSAWGLRKLREAAKSAKKIQGAGFDRQLIEKAITKHEASRHATS